MRCCGMRGRYWGSDVGFLLLMWRVGIVFCARDVRMEAMATVTMELPADVFSALRRSPEEFAGEMRLAAAIYWYSRGEVSQGKAAQIAGMERVQFIDELARRRADAFVVDMADLRGELRRG